MDVKNVCRLEDWKNGIRIDGRARGRREKREEERRTSFSTVYCSSFPISVHVKRLQRKGEKEEKNEEEDNKDNMDNVGGKFKCQTSRHT